MKNKIVQKCINFLDVMTDKNWSESALINVANAKLTHLLSIGGAKFRQYVNGNDVILSYYGINFLPSGYGKDRVLNLFNQYLTPFVAEYMERVIEDYKTEFEEQERLKINNLDKKNQKQATFELAAKINNFRHLNIEIHDATVLGLYADAEIISRLGKGGLFIRMEELGDYIDGVTTGNKQKKELFEKLKEISDGTFSATTISGDNKRKTLTNIPVSAMLYSDFENFKTTRNREYLNKMLLTGISRRSFIFMEETKKINKIIPYTIKQEAITKARELSVELRNIFNEIKAEPYYMSEEAHQTIDNYRNECIEKYNNEIDVKNVTIKGLDIKESYWKIQKLAVVYHILNNPSDSLIRAADIQEAIDFYSSISKSFNILAQTHGDSPAEKLIKFIIGADTDTFKMGDFRARRFVNDMHFKKWFDEVLPDVQDIMRTKHNIDLIIEGKKIHKRKLPIKGEDDLIL